MKKELDRQSSSRNGSFVMADERLILEEGTGVVTHASPYYKSQPILPTCEVYGINDDSINDSDSDVGSDSSTDHLLSPSSPHIVTTLTHPSVSPEHHNFLFNFLLFLCGFSVPWFQSPKTLRAIVDTIWSFIYFVIVTFCSVVITIDCYYQWNSLFIFALSFSVPLPLIVLACNIYFSIHGKWHILYSTLHNRTTAHSISVILFWHSLAAIFFSVILTAAVIPGILLPFIRDDTDSKLWLIILNYILIGLIFFYFLVYFTFLTLLTAISRLIATKISSIASHLYSVPLPTTIEYLKQLIRATNGTSKALQFIILFVGICHVGTFSLLFYISFREIVFPIYIQLILVIAIPFYLTLLFFSITNVTTRFQKIRRKILNNENYEFLAKYIAKKRKEKRRSYGSSNDVRRMLEKTKAKKGVENVDSLLERAGWRLYGVSLSRGVVVGAVWVAGILVFVFVQHIGHVQLG
eukprot:TRINITY_DN7527_c0_g1_i1.p1 TRINITY_DN7527_c0_g1~~TRINITY_DN7527_c0_g1_i1.p1  ORF type:complete len:496 (-),score=29.84 TRINITY_DN7527_c0_g1_i1:28-1422(-)